MEVAAVLSGPKGRRRGGGCGGAGIACVLCAEGTRGALGRGLAEVLGVVPNVTGAW